LSNETSIRTIFAYLAHFEILTGLKCNISKTNIMQLGPVDNEIVRRLSDLNLAWTDEIKMLGFTIQNNWDLIMEKNLTNLNKKIVNITNYWKRYGLSMIGRITVYKSLILPHINFICSILSPPEEWFVSMESSLEKFVLGQDTFAKKRIYLPVTNGGLGLVNIRSMVIAIQCTWIKKALISTNDMWKFELKIITNNYTNFIGYGRAGILNNFIESFIAMQQHWTTRNNNFLHVPVLDNINFGYGRGLVNKFNEDFFRRMVGHGIFINMNIVAPLCWKDFLNAANVFKNRAEIGELLGLSVLVLEPEYNRISSGYRSALRKFSVPGAGGTKLTRFLLESKSKGLSKKLRNIITRAGTESSKDYKKFLSATGITIHDDTDTGKAFKKMLFNEWNSSWNKQFLLPEIRSFLFKFYANTLKINSRVANFNPDINQACDFCIIKKNLPAPKESIQHFFWDCEISNRLLQYAINEIFGPNFATKDFFFTGRNADPVIRQSKINLNLTILDIMKYVLWEFKWAKKFRITLALRIELNIF
jgi:hypothetical protein